MAGRLKRKLSKQPTDEGDDNPKISKKDAKTSCSTTTSVSTVSSGKTGLETSGEPKTTKDGDTPVDKLTGKRFQRSFYNKSCTDLSKSLLGKKLYHSTESGQTLCGKIVETEAYLGGDDKGAHSYQGKRTEKNEAMYMQPGTAYVYNIYGMYCCVNVSSIGDGAAVLIRALEPLEGLEFMKKCRSGKKKACKTFKNKELCNGPSKLCQAFNIDKKMLNKQDLTTFNRVWLEDGDDVPDVKIVECKRIGIDYAGDWAAKPLRYYILGNECVSKKDKDAEKAMKSG